MLLPEGYNKLGVDPTITDFYKWRAMGKCTVQDVGTVWIGGTTSRWNNSYASQQPSNQQGQVAQGINDYKSGYWVGNAQVHGHPTAYYQDVAMWFVGDWIGSNFLQDTLNLPYFTTLGNTPASITDRDVLVKQLYDAGMYFLNQGNTPPINVNVLLNYEYDQSECWDGGTTVFDRSLLTNNSSGGPYDGDVTNNQGWGDELTPWQGVFPHNGTAYIQIPASISPSGNQLTHEYCGVGSLNSTRYISDARNGIGTWFLTNYSGYEINWNGQNTVNLSGRIVNKHHVVATGDSDTNTSRIYFGDSSLGYSGLVGSGGCTTNMVDIGTNFVIGARYTFSGKWDGSMACYRLWDGVLTADQAEICYLHNKWRIQIS